MQSGPPICRLAARARPTSGNGCSGWPTPKAQEDGRTLEQYEDGRQRGYEKRKGLTSGGPASKQGGLAIAAQLAGWPTPREIDSTSNTEMPEARMKREGRDTCSNLSTAALLAGWATPTAHEKARSEEFQQGRELNAREALAGWGSPRASETGRCRSEEAIARAKLKGGSVSVEDQVHLVSGPPTTSSPAATESRGALNPGHSRWLQGYPAAWCVAAIRASRSTLARRRKPA